MLLHGGDAVEEGQCESAVRDGFGEGQASAGRVGVCSPSRLQMNGGEIAAGGDAPAGEGCADAFAVDVFRQADDVNEPADGAVGEGQWRQFEAGEVGEQGAVSLGCSAAQGEQFVNAGKLNAAQGAGDIGEAVIKAVFGVVEPVGACPALIAEASETGGVGRIVG